MSKHVLISCLLLSLAASSSLRGADPSSEGNYDDLQAFLSGFMSGYTGSASDMSKCLTPETQSNLDQILASTYGYIFTGKFAELKETYETFLHSMAQACGQCGLTTVESSLKTGMAAKGKIWYEVNLAYNYEKVEVAFKTAVSQIKEKNWAAAGNTVGQLTDLLVPFEATPVKLMQFMEVLTVKAFNTVTYQSWWKGLVNTLQISTKKQGPCALYLLNFGNSSIPLATDVYKINSNDWSGMNTLFGDAATLLTYVQKSYTTDICDVALLEQNIKDLFSKAGAFELASRYAAKASLINASYNNIKNCDVNMYTCGQAYGNMIKYLLNWSIN
jgi:hypothetical protein